MVYRTTLAMVAALTLNLFPSLTNSVAHVGSRLVQSTPTRALAPSADDSADTLFKKSLELAEIGKFRDARDYVAAACRIWRQTRQYALAVQALFELGERARRANRWQEALGFYRDILSFDTIPDRTRILVCRSIGEIYARLRQPILARRYLQMAIEPARKMADPVSQAEILTDLASLYLEEDENSQAQSYLEQARKLLQNAKEVRVEASTLILLGRCYRQQGRLSEADAVIRETLTVFRDSGDFEREANALCYLSEIALSAGQKESALKYASQSLAAASKLKSSDTLWRAWLTQARSQRALGLDKDALKSYWRAFSLVEMQRVYLTTDAFKISFLSDREASYRELTELLIETNQTDQAFETVEFSRARASLDQLARARNGNDLQLDTASSAKAKTLIAKIAELRSNLRSRSLFPDQQSSEQAELQDAELRLDELQRDAEVSHLKTFIRPVGVKQVQQLLRPADGLVEFFVGEKNIYIWLVTPTESTCVTVPGVPEIEKRIKTYLKAISTRPNNSDVARSLAKQKTEADSLFQLIFGGLTERLTGIERFIIVPDLWLNYLPIETLRSNDRYLIEDREIAYAPSASVLALLKQPRSDSDSDSHLQLLAFGDPVITSHELAPLPNTRREIQEISQYFTGDQRQVYLGKAATEEALKSVASGRVDRLHLATHSVINEELPSLTGLVLTAGKAADDDGFLDIDEIARLRLNCDLVVLSACSTGRGQLVRGEGLVGLTRAFLYAGARSVVVSLWNVSDLSTADLMRDFYSRLAEKADKSAALRQAKLSMLHSDKAERHPYYWSAFMLVGKPD